MSTWVVRAARVALVVWLTAAVLWLAGAGLERLATTLDANVAKAEIISQLSGRSFDVLFLGDSTTLDGLSPSAVDQIAGTHSFNLATGGQSLLASQAILRDHIRRNRKPRLVLLGIFVNRLPDSGGMSGDLYYRLEKSARDWYSEAHARLQGRRLARSYPLLNWIRAYRYRQVVGPLLKWLVRGREQVPVFEDGHLVFEYSRPPVLGSPHPAGVNWKGLIDLIHYCKSNDIQIALFEPPNHPGYSQLSVGRGEALSKLRQISDELEVPFRSFNDRSSLDYRADEWLGTNHLNRSGAQRFSSEQIGPFVRSLLEKEMP